MDVVIRIAVSSLCPDEGNPPEIKGLVYRNRIWSTDA